MIISLIIAFAQAYAAQAPIQLLRPDLLSKIDSQILERSWGLQPVPAIVVMKRQANLSKMPSIADRKERTAKTVHALWHLAKKDQQDLANWLLARDIPFQQFYIFNGLALHTATPDVLADIAGRSDVERIFYNPTTKQLIRPAAIGSKSSAAPALDGHVTKAVQKVGALKLWKKGILGQGVVVGIQDTGINYKHRALLASYRGYRDGKIEHDYHWHDAIHFNLTNKASVCGESSPEPCDDDGHGTHVTGTVTGKPLYRMRFSVAPKAKFIGCRNMQNSYGSPATYIECSEWFLAPYPRGHKALDDFSKLRPDLSPDIISNSWGCPPEEGCDAEELMPMLAAIKAAGIINVSAAGNEASPYVKRPEDNCSTIKYQPSTASELTFSVGAVHTETLKIAYFSSRGPSLYDQKIGPDVVAPGVQIVSADLGGNWFSSLQGTSMAAPHVSGVLALAISALKARNIPYFPETLISLVKKSARPLYADVFCSPGENETSIPNNTFGHGLVDAVKLIQMLKVETE